MRRYALSAALLAATLGTAMAAQREATNSATASQLALAIRACNQLEDEGQRESCKKEAWDDRSYNVRTPLREPGRFERTHN